ncbi:MAG: hypothetical protein M1834_007081 [Cirrosporium novae-zelandiae]|nr:MAG: hypothetical protein M1834_007081 [Cirrosporium novae-zelandiae]
MKIFQVLTVFAFTAAVVATPITNPQQPGLLQRGNLHEERGMHQPRVDGKEKRDPEAKVASVNKRTAIAQQDHPHVAPRDPTDHGNHIVQRDVLPEPQHGRSVNQRDPADHSHMNQRDNHNHINQRDNHNHINNRAPEPKVDGRIS